MMRRRLLGKPPIVNDTFRKRTLIAEACPNSPLEDKHMYINESAKVRGDKQKKGCRFTGSREQLLN
jgi:hypothetical protein